MAKTVKITTDNLISVVEVPWDVLAQGKMIGADCIETVNTQRIYDLFQDYVVMIVDESGLIKNRPDNPVASYLYGADIHGCTIAGDVLFGIQKGQEILPPDDAESMKNFLMKQFEFLLEAKEKEKENLSMKMSKIIKDLKTLASYCDSMVDSENPACIWKSYVETLTQAIEKLQSECVGTDPAEIICNLLEKEGLNQKKLADRMGVTRQSVSQMINRNKVSMRFDGFSKMISALGYEIVARKK